MQDNKKLQRLAWLLEEIDSDLQLATEALDKYLLDPTDAQQLSDCYSRVHNIHGSLNLADLDTELLLVAEIEQVLDLLRIDLVDDIVETCGLLVEAFLQLSNCLNALVYRHQSNPVTIMQVSNDLRALRKAPLVTAESDLFTPDFTHLANTSEPIKKITPEAFKTLLKKLLQMHRYARQAVLEGKDVSQNFGYLSKVYPRITQLAKGLPQQNLWKSASGLVETLEAQTLVLGPGLKQLFLELEQQLSAIEARGYEALEEPLDEDLLKNILFYISVSQCDGNQCAALRTLFKLDDAFDQLTSPIDEPDKTDVQTSLALSEAFTGEIEQIKDFLERFVLEGEDTDLLEKACKNALTLAASLDLVGMGPIKQQAAELADKLKKLATGQLDTHETLIEVASQLVAIETALYRKLEGRNSSTNSESAMVIDSATQTLIREARRSLERVKETIVDYLASEWQQDKLDGIPELLIEAIGAFQILNQIKVAELLEACNRFIIDQLLGLDHQKTPEWKKLDALAETITSIEYYMDFLDKRQPESAEQVLAAALEKLPLLGVAVSTDSQSEVPTPGSIKIDKADLNRANVTDVEDQPDEEIIDIFVEEATEVVGELVNLYPSWVENASNLSVLKDIRRGFHTLKGSGRMVNAHLIGDLAWAIENLLNKVIDQRIENSPMVMAIIDLVIEQIPAMVGAFKSHNEVKNPVYVKELIQTAEKLSKGEGAEIPVGVVETENQPTEVDVVVSGLEDDDDLFIIFADEIEEYLNTVSLFVAEQRHHAPVYSFPPGDVQRALHTLKGSAKMAGIDPIAELVSPLEHFIKELFHRQIDVDADIVQLLDDAVSYFRQAIVQIRAREPIQIPASAQFVARLEELKNRSLMDVYQEDGQSTASANQVDPTLLNAVMEQGLDHILDADQLLANWLDNQQADFIDSMLHELEHLKESADKAGIAPLTEVSNLLINAYVHVKTLELSASQTLINSLEEGHQQLLDMIDTVAASMDVQPLFEAVKLALIEITSITRQPKSLLQFNKRPLTTVGNFAGEDIDRDILETFLLEADELSSEFDEALNNWQQNYQDTAELNNIKRILHTFKGGARMAGLRQLGEMSHELESDILVLERQIDHLDSGIFDYLFAHQDNLNKALAKAHGWFGNQQIGLAEPEIVTSKVIEPEAFEPEVIEPEVIEPEPVQTEAVNPEPELQAEDNPNTETFYEQNWQDTPDQVDRIELDIPSLPDTSIQIPEDQSEEQTSEIYGSKTYDSHELDSHVLDSEVLNSEIIESESRISDAHVSEDHVSEMHVSEMQVSEVYTSDGVQTPDSLGNQPQEQPAFSPETEQQPLNKAAEPEPPFVEQNEGQSNTPALAPTEVADLPEDLPVDRAKVNAPVFERKETSQEMIRVAAPVLETLVNLAGESSISRGRIEQQISQFHGSLEDMETTIRQLQGQVRLLGIETEAQVMFRREQIEASDTVEGFDPLEMDRYSQLQQIAKSLLESSSDLLDLKGTLLNVARDAETQLLQQSRIQSDLQEGLMRARMVSFSHIVPRLRRIVRQLGNELDKQVKLDFTNIEGEMDRSVLEKMIAPLEHMIRNAMDHGIESANKRSKSGKNSLGTITIGMVRRGGEVIIQVADDGQGLNIDAIRNKALQKGLMVDDATLSDHQIAQFIFNAGFSTSENVSQVSGRGVGMDVVFSQVRQLGGTIDLTNKPGDGLTFQIRLPFTVSVNRALMVRLRDDLYALPLNSIDGVVNVPPQQLEDLYKNTDLRLEYGNQQYLVRYLGGLLTDDLAPKIDFAKPYVSLVLVHSETGLFAVHVDALLSSQEVVVKSLGEQFSKVAGLSGATILSDGQVVVILDLLELLRAHSALASSAVRLAEDVEHVRPSAVQKVMVVDDSVTVRKVTTRFLEREGFDVLTAKDGVEALELLQDHLPDLILLDIEMPRMDGFEVAERVKSSQQWQSIPIIMVTSRTGEKHRNRASEIGVEDYVGKPFQEDELLEKMAQLMTMTVD